MHFKKIVSADKLTRNFLAEAAKVDLRAAEYRARLIADSQAYRTATAEDRASQERFHGVMDRLADRWDRAQSGERVGRWSQPAAEQRSGYPFDVAAE